MNKVLLVLFLGLFVLNIRPAAAGDIGFGLSISIGNVDPMLVPVGETTLLSIPVTNTGQQSNYRMEIDAQTGLNASLPSASSYDIPGSSVRNFTVAVNPSSAGNYTLKVEFYGVDPPFEPKVSERTFTITSVAPPETFIILTPEENAIVKDTLQLAWSNSQNADAYDVFIYEYSGPTPVRPAKYSYTELLRTNFNLNVGFLERGARYGVEVYAKNAIGAISNAEGLRSFIVEPLASPSGFSLIQPVPNDRTTLTPRFVWQAAENTISYRVNVFAEVNGVPVTPPIRQVNDILTTSYDWSNPPLDPSRNYYVTIEALGEGGTIVQNVEGPVKFFAAGIEDFYLVYPEVNDFGINPAPEFRWQPAIGAHGYVIYVYEELSEGERLVHQTFVPQGDAVIRYFMPAGKLLKSDSVFRWTVIAFRSDDTGRLTEVRENADYDRRFRTTRMSPFLIVYPDAGRNGVSQRPTFEWTPTSGAGNYFVELTRPTSAGVPNTSSIQMSPPIEGATTWTSTFSPLSLGAEYFWRVWGFDGNTVVYNTGEWQKFKVTTLEEFDLLSPEDDTASTSLTVTLEWETVPSAAGYLVHLSLPGRLDYEPFLVDRNINSITLPQEKLKLNSLTDYEWWIEAFGAEPGDLRASNSTRTFDTGRRGLADPTLGACDVLEHLLGIQRLTAPDRLMLGTSVEPSIDASAFLRAENALGVCER